MFRVIHNECGKLAFYFKIYLKKGEIIRSDNVVHIDGTQAVSGEPIICESCGKPIHPSPYTVTIEEENWADWFINDKVRNKNVEASVALTGQSA